MSVPMQRASQFQQTLQSSPGTQSRDRQRNAALAALTASALSALELHLRHGDFPEGAVLWDAGEPASRVYFPASGMISVIVPLKDGRGIEVASIGREAGVGMEYQMRPLPLLTRGVVQVAGMFSYMPVSQFAAATREREDIKELAAYCSDWLLTQAQQIAACNAAHSADARFCRWLLQSSEHMESDMVPSTQEAIAQLLGIRRTTVTLIAQRLQVAGVISYKRGRIAVRDRQNLQSAACDCHLMLGRQYWPSVRLTKNQPQPETVAAPSSASVQSSGG